MITDVERTVLVVDDEPTIVDVVSRYLERAGYRTCQAYAGPEAVIVARDCQPDLIVLDVMLPGFDGYEVMRRLADGDETGTHSFPVILLTARGEESDRIVGLRRGADDYVVKPFSPAEIVARVDAVLRRASPSADTEPPLEEIVSGELRIEPAGRTVFLSEAEVALTAREFDLLWHLARNPGRVFTRDQLMQTVWNTEVFEDTSTVTVHVRRLRAKIETDPANPQYIETARGVGYRFRNR